MHDVSCDSFVTNILLVAALLPIVLAHFMAANLSLTVYKALLDGLSMIKIKL